MARIEGIDPVTAEPYARKVLAEQESLWGAPLLNHLLYARRPDLLRGVRGMWAALNRDQILPAELVALVNRRVAALNGCVF